MFKKDYKAALDAVVPSEESLAVLEEKMRNTPHKKRGLNTVATTVLALAAALAIFVGVITVKTPVDSGTAGNNVTVSAKVSYDDVYKKLKAINTDSFLDTVRSFFSGRVKGVDMAEGSISSDSVQSPEYASSSSNSDKIDYSDTNLQVLGVQEEDVVKTDGKFFYILSRNANGNQSLIIAAVLDGGNVEKLCETLVSDKTNKESATDYSGMYIFGDKLVMTGYMYKYEKDGEIYYGSYYGSRTEQKTVISVWNISDRTAPSLDNTLTQSGYAVATRMIDSVLYTVSSYYVYYDNADKNEPTTYIPETGVSGGEICMQPRDLCIAPDSTASQYVIVTALDVENNKSFKSEKAVFGATGDVYASTENLYVTSSLYHANLVGNYNVKTGIIKFSLGDTVEMSASGEVDGYTNNQFSMDEYNGYFRIATTVQGNDESSNSLFILDKNLKVAGKIEDLAPTERIYSVRFDGDIGYVVTYRQTDPLFAIDLSDPTSPKVLSALKIPGFSTYMQKFGENTLVGIGYDDSFRVKLSLFDVTDKADVKEKDVTVLNIGWTEALYNHKAILINESKNIIGFACNDGYLNDGTYIESKAYFIYGYDAQTGSFIKRAALDDSQLDILRGFYIGEYFYTVGNYGIAVYNLADFTEVSVCSFGNN